MTDRLSFEPSVPSDGFECYWLMSGRVQVGSLNGPQTPAKDEFALKLVAAFNATIPAIAMTETDAQLIRETIQIIEAHYLMTFGEIRVAALRRAAARTPDDMQGWLEHRAAQRGLTIDELREYDLLLIAKQKLPEDFNAHSEGVAKP